MRSSSTEFDRRITIEHLESRYDEYKNEIGEWVDHYSCYAGIITTGNNSTIEESRPDYNTVIEFKIRYCLKALQIVPETYRIRYGGAVYKILSAVDINAAHQIIKIKAVVDNG